MIERSRPLFLARQSYRRRRLIDGMRLLPLFGGVVMLTPLLWTEPGTGSLAVRGLYLFAAWALLVVIAAVLAWYLERTPEATDAGRTRDPGADPGENDVL